MDGDKNFDFVNVAIRIKPSPLSQSLKGKSLTVISNEPPVILVPEKQATYAFDHIFSENASQEVVYNKMVQPLVRKVVHGYNSTVFAYGQTGTGKTFTIGSDPTCYDNIDAGLITRALNDVMTLNENDENIEVSVFISFFEIYNEKVYDLLTNNKAALQVKGFKISGLTKQKVESLEDARNLQLEGGKNRHTGETKSNSKSSRSHAIFTIYCNVKHLNHETEAKLNLVDLAGSESVKKTGNEGNQFHEGININKGLLCIGQVINALSSNHLHVPYRQSTITTILKDSLNKKNYVTLIACIGTNIDDLTETVQTLDFAQRAKKLRNRPELNTIISEYTKSYNGYGSVRNTPLKPVVPFTPYSRGAFQFRTPSNAQTQTILRRPQQKLSTNFSAFDSRVYHEDNSSIYSANLSSASRGSAMPSTLSPIIKSCIDAVENRFIERLTSIVNNMSTPLHRVNSPRITRSSLEREVTKIVRTKMCYDPQFCTFRNEINSIGDSSTSSVDDNDGVAKACKTSNGYLDGRIETSFIITDRNNATAIFKKPMYPPNSRGRKSTIPKTSSPIEEYVSPLAALIRPRRSIRLSTMHLRKSSMNGTRTDSVSPTVRQVRRSTRVQNLELQKCDGNKDSPILKRKPKSTVTRKKSDNIMDVNRTKAVLKLLNQGSVKNIMELYTIGPKCAAMICQFREIKGSFRKISDLRNMWGAKGYQRFLQTNFLVPHTP